MQIGQLFLEFADLGLGLVNYYVFLFARFPKEVNDLSIFVYWAEHKSKVCHIYKYSLSRLSVFVASRLRISQRLLWASLILRLVSSV